MKVLKSILFAVLALALLVMLGLGAVLWLTEPNDYKPQIVKLVKDATGRDLSIPGDIGLSVFPWLGLKLGEVSLGNAEGFKPHAFATIQATDVRVALWPLLRDWKLQVGVLKFKGLRLNLERNAQGVANWDDLLRAEQTETQAAEPSAVAPPDFEIGGLQLDDANVQWRDQQAGTVASIEKLQVRTGRIVLDKPVDISAQGLVSSQNPGANVLLKLEGRVESNLKSQIFVWPHLNIHIEGSGEALPFRHQVVRLDMALTADLARQVFELQAAKLSLDAKDASLPGGAQRVKMDFDANINLETQVARFSRAQIGVMDMMITAQWQAQHILEQPEVDGHLKIETFSPRKLLHALGEEIPITADAQVLQRAQVESQFAGTSQHMLFKQLQLVLDDTRISGSAELRGLDQEIPFYGFDLSLDSIDADRYLPPVPPEPVVSAESQVRSAAQLVVADEPIVLPVETFRALDAAGHLQIGRLKMMNLKMQDFASGIQIKDGVVKFNPVQVDLYKGNYKGYVLIDVREDKPHYDLNIQLTGIDALPLLQDFTGDAVIEGLLGLQANLQTQGDSVSTLKQQLNGKFDFSFADGALAGLNLGEKLREVQAKVRREEYHLQGTKKTDFATTVGSAVVQSGIVTFNTFKLEAPAVRASLSRSVNLVTEALDLHIDAYVVDTKTGQAGKELEQVKSIYVPVDIKGTFLAPQIDVDEKAFLKGLLSSKQQKQLEEKRQALEQKQQEVSKHVDQALEQKKQQIEEKVEDKKKDLKSRLKQRLQQKL